MKHTPNGNRLRQFTEVFTKNLGLKILSLLLASLLYLALAPQTAEQNGALPQPILPQQFLVESILHKPSATETPPATEPQPATTNAPAAGVLSEKHSHQPAETLPPSTNQTKNVSS